MCIYIFSRYELYEEAGHSSGHGSGHASGHSTVASPTNNQILQAVAVADNNLLQLVPCPQGQQPPMIGQVPLALPSGVPYNIPPPPPSNGTLSHHPYVSPYSYVQQMPQNLGHHYSQPHVTLHTHSMHPSYMATYPYQNQTFAPPTIQNIPQNTATVYHANISHLRPPPSPEGNIRLGAPPTVRQSNQQFGLIQQIEPVTTAQPIQQGPMQPG